MFKVNIPIEPPLPVQAFGLPPRQAQTLSTVPLTAFCDATILTGEATVEGHALLARGVTIVDIVSNNHIPDEANKISGPDQIITAGLIDAQVNGGGNVQLNNCPTEEACLTIAKAHRKYGTTGLLLTCISDTTETTSQAIKAIRQARKEDRGILGIHLEGPHLGMEKRGVHSPNAIRQLKPEDISIYKHTGDEVMVLTVAPENVSVDDIKALSKQAIVSLGHTNALPEQIRAALAAGATGFTHLYNAMGGMSARAPGVIGAALDDLDSWCGIIANDHHVMPEMIRLALRSKALGKVFLVSDAMAPAATDVPQPFDLYGQKIDVANGRCTTADGNLAGSAITLLDAVKYCVKKVGVDIEEAFRMASTYPAAFLGLDKKFGKLLPNYSSDLIVLDRELNLLEVWPAGFA